MRKSYKIGITSCTPEVRNANSFNGRVGGQIARMPFGMRPNVFQYQCWIYDLRIGRLTIGPIMKAILLPVKSAPKPHYVQFSLALRNLMSHYLRPTRTTQNAKINFVPVGMTFLSTTENVLLSAKCQSSHLLDC